MKSDYKFEDKELFEKINLLANPARFKIYELSKNKNLNETEISKLLKIKYKRVSEAINKMQRAGLISLLKRGRESIVCINSKITIK